MSDSRHLFTSNIDVFGPSAIPDVLTRCRKRFAVFLTSQNFCLKYHFHFLYPLTEAVGCFHNIVVAALR